MLERISNTEYRVPYFGSIKKGLELPTGKRLTGTILEWVEGDRVGMIHTVPDGSIFKFNYSDGIDSIGNTVDGYCYVCAN